MKGSSHFKCKPHCLAFSDNCSKCIHCGHRTAVRTGKSPKASTWSQSAPGKARVISALSTSLKNTFSPSIMLVDKSRNQLLHFLIQLHTQRVLVDSTASHMHSALVHCVTSMSWNTTLAHMRVEHLVTPAVYRQPEDRSLPESQGRRR